MKIRKCPHYAVLVVLMILMKLGAAEGADFVFQPRLEVGMMNYSFESEAVSVASLSKSVPYNSGHNYTQQAFEYSDTLFCAGVGGTLFFNRVFLDFSGQFAFDGQDKTMIAYSGYNKIEYDSENRYMDSGFISSEPVHEAKFDRNETAISLGYMINRQLSVFIGYKWAKTEFSTAYRGKFGFISYNSDGKDTLGGWMTGEVDYTFEYKGPFIGAIQGWEFGRDSVLGGSLSASLALAYLESEVTLDRIKGKTTATWMNGQPVPETDFILESGGLSNRYDTKGESLGLTVGLAWRGSTPVEGLSYTLGISGYRYEFEAQENSQSNVNENVFIFKCGISYAF